MYKRLLILLCSMVMLFSSALAESAAVQPDPNARFRDVPTLELDGELYRLNRHITTILLMGIDQTAAQGEGSAYRSGGQADFLLLLAVNDTAKTITAIQINRDTMVDLQVLNVLGEEIGTRSGQICLAHAFGDGAQQSCKMTCDAVSELLNDAPIHYYVSMDMDGIAALNDALGGVEVTLEDDFTAFDASMTKGTTLTLRGAQAEYFVRARYDVGDQTNLSRQERQQLYMNAALTALKSRMQENGNFIRSLYSQLEDCLLTDLSRGAIYNLGEKATRYEFLSIQTLSGETRLGESGFMEFYPDTDALNRLLVEALYEKAAY